MKEILSILDVLDDQIKLWDKINCKVELNEEEKGRFNMNKVVIGRYEDMMLMQGDRI